MHELSHLDPVFGLPDVDDVGDAGYIEEFLHALELGCDTLHQRKRIRMEHSRVRKIDNRENHDVRGEFLIHLEQELSHLVMLGKPGGMVVVYLELCSTPGKRDRYDRKEDKKYKAISDYHGTESVLAIIHGLNSPFQ